MYNFYVSDTIQTRRQQQSYFSKFCGNLFIFYSHSFFISQHISQLYELKQSSSNDTQCDKRQRENLDYYSCQFSFSSLFRLSLLSSPCYCCCFIQKYTNEEIFFFPITCYCCCVFQLMFVSISYKFSQRNESDEIFLCIFGSFLQSYVVEQVQRRSQKFEGNFWNFVHEPYKLKNFSVNDKSSKVMKLLQNPS